MFKWLKWIFYASNGKPRRWTIDGKQNEALTALLDIDKWEFYEIMSHKLHFVHKDKHIMFELNRKFVFFWVGPTKPVHIHSCVLFSEQWKVDTFITKQIEKILANLRKQYVYGKIDPFQNTISEFTRVSLREKSLLEKVLGCDKNDVEPEVTILSEWNNYCDRNKTWNKNICVK